MHYPSLRATGALIALALSVSTWAASPEIQADKNRIKAHLSFLADDLMEGRDTGSRAFDIAAKYVTSQFMQYGVAPKGDNGAYLQRVPLRSSTLDMDSPEFEIVRKDGSREKLSFLNDFTMSAGLVEAKSEVTAPVVFVGYGVEAPAFKHNDYDGLDVKGKVVIMMAGRPAGLPTEEGAHFGSNDAKRASAFAHGAVGIITLTPPRAGRPAPNPAMLKEFIRHPRMTWTMPNGELGHEYPGMQSGAGMTPAAAEKLFDGSGTKAADLFAAAVGNKPLPRVALDVQVHLKKESRLSPLFSANVVGIIEGSDPQLKNEYVVYSAHLDHVGVDPEKTGDNIYNGAMDNASGVATLLEMARLIQAMPVKPKRSMIFIALTGEEKGLLGSDFYAHNPTVPMKDIVASVNLDMPILTYDFSNVVAFGAEHSSMKGPIERAAQQTGIALIPDAWPEQRLFVRSDHYNFVRQGVPSIFLVTGTGSFNKDEDGKKIFDEFVAKHYHKVTDDLNLPINWDAAARFAQVNYRIGVELANDKERPSWNKGDFFGTTFGRKQ